MAIAIVIAIAIAVAISMYSHSHKHHTQFGDETMVSVQPGTYMIVADNYNN